MKYLCLALGALIGVLLTEVAARTYASKWLHLHLQIINNFPSSFRKTDGDDARQALVLKTGFEVLRFSMSLVLLMSLIALLVMLPPIAFFPNEQEQILYWFLSTISATVWWFSRPYYLTKVPNPTALRDSYSMLDKFFHWVVLKPSVVRRLTFDLECSYALPKRNRKKELGRACADPVKGPVYVCGLARSGTTVLLRILDQIDVFRSLTYRDMPFVLAPNLWRLITQYNQAMPIAEERAHGDGIKIDVDSPEGFEEVFWRTFGTYQVSRSSLGANEPTQSLLEDFGNYRELVANPKRESISPWTERRRYLSKNNNNLMRLRSLSQEPTATILLIFRNPPDVARSLHRLHMSFCKSQKNNNFTHAYMNWLGHHEFGLGHLPFQFAMSEMDPELKPTDVNYWLDYWIAVHNHILSQPVERLYLINHDDMRAEPVETLAAIFKILGISADASNFAQHIAAPAPPTKDIGFNPTLLKRAFATHHLLLACNKNLTRRSNYYARKHH